LLESGDRNGMELKTFQTNDLYLASALKLSGFKLVDLERNENGRGIFVFQDRADRTQWVRNYYSGDLQGSLKSFSSVWADLKALVVEMEREMKDEKSKR
jgi:predicted RNA-binding protein YlxR (DUF448 family)